ncbi:MAG: hypothetical protein K0U78_14925 [Actinomycetia bacterium]|nr:hypothetical protein [Actinomycetes bacterium]
MSDYPIKSCDYCEHVGKTYTFRDGETICKTCLSKYPTTARDCRIKIKELENQLVTAKENQKHLILEHMSKVIKLESESIPKSEIEELLNYDNHDSIAFLLKDLKELLTKESG